MKNIYFWMLTLFCSTLMFSGTNNFTFETQTKGWSMFQTRAFGPDTAFKYDGNFNHVFYANTSATLAEPYCTPEGTNSSRYINNFTTSPGISNLNSGFSEGGYGEFNSMTVSQGAGGSVNFTANVEGGTAGFRIWVDWNQDGEFDTSTEVAYASNAYLSNHEGSFTVPASALTGQTTMRIVSNWLSTSGDVDPCVTGFTYGEFEDYTFNVTTEIVWDCPNHQANIGDSCDDGDATTSNDTLNENCECEGIPTATNDEACTATTLACGDVIMQTLIGATESFEDSCFGSGTSDVWFTFTSDGSQIMTVAETSSFDAVVQLFVGDDCGNLVEAAACKDSPENFTVSEAGTYYFRVRPYFPSGNAGTIEVELTCTTPPSNDDCIDAIALECGDDPITISSIGSTAVAPSGCTLGENGLWFSFEGTGGDITINSSATFDHKMSMQTGSCDELTWIACRDESYGAESYTIESTVANQMYYVYVTHFISSSTTTGDITIGIECTTPPACIPPTDVAISDITDSSFSVSWTPGADNITWSVAYGNEGWDPVNDAPIDYANFISQPEHQFTNLDSNTTYDLYLIPFCEIDFGDMMGPYTFTTLEIALDNNDCMDATALACGDSISGSTYGATESGMGSPSCSSGTPADVFYTIDAVPNMNYTVSVQGDDYDGVLAIYSGTCGNLTELDCADDSFSAGVMETIEFSVNEPTMIYVRTYDWSSSRGDFTISLACEEVTTCTSPLGMSVNDVTESSANISWTPANDGDNMWEISLTTGGQAAADGLISQIQGTPSHMATDLNPETQYSVYLRTICSEQESSEWEYNGDFTTLTAVQEPCIAPSLSLEVVSNTDGAPIGDCIETEEVFYVSATLVGGSGNANYVVSANGGETTNLEADTSHLFGPFNAGTDVEITATGIDDASCTAVESVLSPDICIATPCDSPLGIVVDNITESTADITWSPANDGDNMWEISLTTGGQSADQGMTDMVSGTPMYSASGLNSSTTYRVYLRTICADGTSEWTYNGEFTTDEATQLYDCPILQANIGDSCDDSDETTENDVVTDDCECMGTPIVVEPEFDCPELQANIGDSCDDSDETTENDVVTDDCECAGTPIVVDPEECVAPTEVTIERLSPTSIAISTNVEVWSMYVDIFNNPPSFNSRTKSHWTKLRNTYINNNVVPNRTYYLWFRTNCPNGELSEYTELYTVEPWAVARSSSNPNATINQVHEQLVNVDVFPNPTSDELNISGINAQQIRIFDSNGTAIFNGRVINNQLNLRQLQTGVYRMVITDENNREHAVQVIKR